MHHFSTLIYNKSSELYYKHVKQEPTEALHYLCEPILLLTLPGQGPHLLELKGNLKHFCTLAVEKVN